MRHIHANFDALIRDELGRLEAGRQRHRMGNRVAFLSPTEARAARSLEPVDLARSPALAEHKFRQKHPAALVDHDAGDEDPSVERRRAEAREVGAMFERRFLWR